MPFVLKHKQSGQIFSCKLINLYDLEYYGVKYWDDPQTAQTEYASFLEQRGIETVSDWQLHEVEENELKLFNVKLNNNGSRRIYLDETGKPIIRIIE